MYPTGVQFYFALFVFSVYGKLLLIFAGRVYLAIFASAEILSFDPLPPAYALSTAFYLHTDFQLGN